MLNKLLVRIGEDKDADTLIEFNMAMAWETERKKLSLPAVTKGVQTVLDDPRHGFYLVAEAANEVLGSLMVTFEWSDWRCGQFWWIQSVYVKSTGKPSAATPHAGFDEAGAGNVAWSRYCDTRKRKCELTGNTKFDLP